MERLDRKTPGDILEEANLGDYIGAMGLGIAEAQEALDRNSISQMLKFTDPLESLGGMSLIQLGLSPAFYHFRSARLSASVSMSLQVKETIDAGFSLDTGGERDVTKEKTRGIKKLNSYERNISISESESIEISESKSGMNAIHAYSEQNTDDGSYASIAQRNYISSEDKSAYSGQLDEQANYSEKYDLIVVPPHQTKWVVFKITDNTNTNFTGITPNITVNEQSAKAAALSLLNQAKSDGFKGGILGANMDPADFEADLSKVHFNHNDYSMKPIVDDPNDTTDDSYAGMKFDTRVRMLAQILKVEAALSVQGIIGYTDATGRDDYNIKLSKSRAMTVMQIIDAHTNLGDKAGAEALIESRGETAATQAGRDILVRRVDVEINVPSGTYYVFLEHSDASKLVLGSLPPEPLKVGGAQFNTNSHFTEDQVDQSIVEVTEQNELRFITYSETSEKEIAQIDVFSKSSEGFTVTESMDSELKESIKTSDSTVNPSRKNVNSTSAVAVSVDARYSRMFDLNMSGNMSIDAELVSIPAPPEFLTFIKDYFGE